MKLFLERFLNDNIYCICRRNKKNLLFTALIFVIGIVLGLFLGDKGLYKGIFEDSIELTVVIFTGKISIWSLIFRIMLINLGHILPVFLFSLSIYLIPLQYLFIAYKGYLFGAALIVFTLSAGISGVCALLLIVLPQQFILLFSIALFIAATQKINIENRFSCLSVNFNKVFVYFCLSLCNILVELLIIYVIIKPFNILI